MTSLTDQTIDTPRLRTHLLAAGPEDGTPVVFIHGNASSSAFFRETLERLPAGVRGMAVDLGGFGASEPRPIDATRGVRDFADDVHALITTLRLAPAHLVGWSVGGSVAMQVAIDHPADLASLLLESPMSPYGFGGTKDAAGTPCWPDWAGTGGGTANPEFVKRIGEGDRSEESPFSPRNVMNAFYFRPPFRVEPEREDRYVESILTTRVGDGFYPGDLVSSEHWPGVAPGTRGMNNAISGKYVNLAAFAAIEPKPSVLWIRGADDQIVSDGSMFDFGYLGSLGAVPGWPAQAYPPQPMIAQLRAVFDAYRANGGAVREEVLPACGHAPHIEQADAFERLLAEAVSGTRAARPGGSRRAHPGPRRLRDRAGVGAGRIGCAGPVSFGASRCGGRGLPALHGRHLGTRQGGPHQPPDDRLEHPHDDHPRARSRRRHDHPHPDVPHRRPAGVHGAAAHARRAGGDPAPLGS